MVYSDAWVLGDYNYEGNADEASSLISDIRLS
jgi:hypothetical protein